MISFVSIWKMIFLKPLQIPKTIVNRINLLVIIALEYNNAMMKNIVPLYRLSKNRAIYGLLFSLIGGQL